MGASEPTPVNYTQFSTGEMWLDTSLSPNNILMVWSGSEWVQAQDGGNAWEVWNDGTDDYIRAKYAYDVIPLSNGSSRLGT